LVLAAHSAIAWKGSTLFIWLSAKKIASKPNSSARLARVTASSTVRAEPCRQKFIAMVISSFMLVRVSGFAAAM
jgi:hypothetical protein